MALHRRKDGDDFARLKWWAFEMTYPPFIESVVGIDIETLLWRRGLCKHVGDVGTVYEEILGGTDSIEHPRAGLVDAVGVSLVKYESLVDAWGATEDATCLLRRSRVLMLYVHTVWKTAASSSTRVGGPILVQL